MQIDSTPCDIHLVDEVDRRVIGRPNFTVAVDLYSRVIPGISVSLEAASTVTVAICLAHACLPREDWLAKRDLAGVHWPIYGRPRTLEYDQGPENEARGIQRGLKRHGIASKVRAKGHPEQHRTIERLIGTMMRIVHGLRGTTFSDIAEPNHTTLSRRVETLVVAGLRPGSGPVNLLVDSPGLKLCGPSEWLIEKHDIKPRRSWRKLHIALDADT